MGERANKRFLQTATTAGALSTSRVVRDGGDVLNAADLHASASEGTEGRLGTGAGALGADTTGSAELDVEGVDAAFLAALDDVLSGEHGGVGGGLITIGLDLHTTGNLGDGFTAGGVGDVNEGIVAGGVDVARAIDEGVLGDVGSETLRFFLLGLLSGLLGHFLECFFLLF